MGSEITAGKQRGRPFKPGQSGNLLGRPKGARHRTTVAAEALLEGEAEALTRKAIELALGGDTTALRLCLERILPPVKDRPVHFPLPPGGGPEDTAGAMREGGPQDTAGAMRAVVAALAYGQITPSEATAVVQVIEACRQAASTQEAPSNRETVINVIFERPTRVPQIE